jgi:cell shape-determining protein MreD
VDFHDGGIVGVIAFTYALVALGINYFRRALFAEHLLTRLALVAAADALQRVAFAISEIIRGQSGGFLLLLRAQALGVIYTTLVAAALLPLLSLIIQKSYGSPRRA